MWGWLAALFGRKTPAAPQTPAPPPPKPDRYFRITPRGAEGGILMLDAAILRVDSYDDIPALGNTEGRLTFVIPNRVPFGPWGAWLELLADGYLLSRTRVELSADINQDWPDVQLELEAPPMVLPLTSTGRWLSTGDRRFHWKGITAFQLVEMVAHGRAHEAAAYLAWCRDNRVNVVRVLAMARHLFGLTPEEGRDALPSFLDLALRHGVYTEVVALADTGAYGMTDQDLEHQVRFCGVAAQAAGNAAVEVANEVLPLHETQHPKLGNVAILKRLAALVPAIVPVSLGSTHADQDENPTLASLSDFATAHCYRGDAEDNWKWVRHTNDLGALADTVQVYAVNDEPRRDDLTPGKHLALGFLCRAIRGIGDTFHYAGGRFAQVPTGLELEAFLSRREGWEIVPEGWNGRYANAGQFGSPVKATRALRSYSTVQGGEAYTLVLNGDGGSTEWAAGWRAELVAARDRALIYHVTR